MIINESDKLDNAPAYMINRLARLLRIHLIQVFQSNGFSITPEQYFLLFRLNEKDGQSQTELARKDLNNHPNMTRHIDSLEKKELVKRVADQNDRRRYLIYLTSKGTELFQNLLPLIARERENLFGNISEQDLNQMTSTFSMIEKNLER